jgi:hypothetical protein
VRRLQARIQPTTGTAGDLFGYHIALEGDTLVVGAAGDANSGAAYVYTRVDQAWTEAAKLVPDQRTPESLFGCNVALYGDTVVVGAQNDDSAARNAGAAYVYAKHDTSWQQVDKLVP